MRFLFLAGVAAAALHPQIAAAQDQSGGEDEIFVTASPFGHESDDTPAITSSVDSDDILKSGGASIADALSKVPGVSGTGFASGASRPVIRGMDSNRVRLLENGTSVSDVSDVGPDHGVPIDPLAARRIEVVRGAATLRYGSQAIGGVVNAINDRVPMQLPGAPLSGEVTGSYGTVDDAWQGSGLVDAALGNIALHADAFVRDTGDYETPLGTQDNSWFRGHGEAFGGSYFFGGGDSHVGAAIEQYDAKYGIPGETSFIDMTQTKVLTRSSFALGSGLLKALSLDGSYADYRHSEIDGGEPVATFTNTEYDVRAELLLNPIDMLANAAFGAEYQHRDFAALGEASSYLLPTTTESVAGYVFVDMEPMYRLHVEVSGRVENVDEIGTPVSGIATSRSFTPLSGAIGALYEVSDEVKVGLLFSGTGRAPGITELFARGPHDGPGTFEFGDPDLQIERANSLEASLRVRSGAFQFEGSVYSSWFKRFIYGDLTGRTCDEDGLCTTAPDGDFREMFYRQQGAHFRGVEGKASYALLDAPSGKLEANLLGDYTRATLDDGNNVPRIPPWRIGGGLDWESDRFDAGFSVTRVAPQDKAGAYDTPTPGYYDIGAQVSWRPFASQPGIEFAVIGQNLANEVARNAAALNKDLVVMPGRNVRFVVKFALP
ncbi:TonB-dependent receptor [Altererythrobacter salegens]|uniref:TonB-dependent receptor n=1 Tax=Croceibacterium salegens TaxID=1737568 RepID=A0A6I4SUF3_9SPHN|nr:TonB-dependent receptor [Croceibacterium salegens]MXO59734.1 TonB-dependent receptor [Croceibacterium salegens]